MTMHLQKFVDRVRGYEARGAKDFIMTLAEAKDVHADITRLLLELHDLRERVSKSVTEDVITVQVGGGSF
jgi:hypothetical protein